MTHIYTDQEEEFLQVFEGYRIAIHAATFVRRKKAQQILQEFEEARTRYQNMMAMSFSEMTEIARRISYHLHLLHLEKTIAGLLFMAALHRLRKCALFQHPVKLNRVRRLTATHPALAPPRFA